jgi:hypothetical protein
MPQNKKQAPPLDTAAGLLLTLTALSGEFPAALVSRLPGGEAYKMKVVKRLKKDKLLHTYYADGLRGFRLTNAAKKLLLDSWSELFSPYLTGRAETNMLKSEQLRRLRLHRMAEVLVAMYNAGVGVFSWQKHAVFDPTPPDDIRIEWPMYYSSREVKEIGPQRDKIRGSRATGVLLTENNVFVVYNAGRSEIKWAREAELRLRAFLQYDLCLQRLSEQYGSAGQSAIIFGNDMKLMPMLMGVDSDQRHKYLVVEEDYNCFYYLTNDHYGEIILRLLCEPDKKAMLDNVLMEGLSEAQQYGHVEHDAMDRECPVLFGYTCDMPRIRRFNIGLRANRLRGILYCFKFQEEALRQICGPNVEIQCMSFETVEGLL